MRMGTLHCVWLALGLYMVLPLPMACQSVVTFDFDAGTPAPPLGGATPFDYASGGMTARFSSPSDPNAFSVQNLSRTTYKLSQFSGSYLSDNNVSRNFLDIKFSQPVTAISLTFATIDYHDPGTGGTGSNIQLTAYMDSTGSTPVASMTTHGTFITGDSYPQGTLSFSSPGKSFNLVELVVPFVTQGATDFFVDNITVTPAAFFASVSAASFAPGAPMAASMIAAGFGQALCSATTVAPPDSLPTTLGGITVKVKDSAGTERLSPLWFVSPGQINYYIPDGSQAGTATVTVANMTQVVVTGQLQIGSVSPGLFSMNNDGRGVAAALAVWAKPDGSQTWQFVFAPGCAPGSCVTTPLSMGAAGDRLYLELFGTGIRGRSSLAAVTATVGGVATPVEYAGPVTGATGLDQVNLAVPATLAGRGEVDILLTVDGMTANPVKVSFQ